LRRARDPELLDAIDALERERFSGAVWRVARSGRDPLLASPSKSRWCNGAFDVLYTSLERDGAIAEVNSLLLSQPVFPSTLVWFVHKLNVSAQQTLKLADLTMLTRLGVDVSRYKDRDYGRTREIADAAYFLGFDGLIAPSARHDCLNAVLFAQRLAPDQISVAASEREPIDWESWSKPARR
jgi:hypothetical protein